MIDAIQALSTRVDRLSVERVSSRAPLRGGTDVVVVFAITVVCAPRMSRILVAHSELISRIVSDVWAVVSDRAEVLRRSPAPACVRAALMMR
jgi:hypothetical protein